MVDEIIEFEVTLSMTPSFDCLILALIDETVDVITIVSKENTIQDVVEKEVEL